MIHAFKPDPVTNRQEAWRFFDFVMHHPESHAHGDLAQEPVGHPGELPGDGRLGRQHLQARQRRGRGGSGEVPLGAQAGRAEPDDARRPRRSRPRTSATRPRTSTTRSSAATSRSGSSASRSWRTASIPNSTSIRSTTPSAGPRTSSRCCRSAGWCSTANPDNFFAEVEQSAFGTGVLVDGIDFSDDKMLQGRTLVLLRHAALPRRAELPAAPGQRAAEGRDGSHQPARRADDLLRRRHGREPARQLRAERDGRS